MPLREPRCGRALFRVPGKTLHERCSGNSADERIVADAATQDHAGDRDSAPWDRGARGRRRDPQAPLERRRQALARGSRRVVAHGVRRVADARAAPAQKASQARRLARDDRLPRPRARGGPEQRQECDELDRRLAVFAAQGRGRAAFGGMRARLWPLGSRRPGPFGTPRPRIVTELRREGRAGRPGQAYSR